MGICLAKVIVKLAQFELILGLERQPAIELSLKLLRPARKPSESWFGRLLNRWTDGFQKSSIDFDGQAESPRWSSQGL